MTLLERVDAFWREPMPARRLATLRILAGVFATVYAAVRLVHLADYAKLDASQFRPVGMVSLLSHPLPATATWALAIATPLAGLAFVLGWRFRLFGPLFAALFMWVTSYRSSWGMIFHNDNLLALHLVVLAATRSADAYALDGQGAECEADHGWPVRLICALTALAYFVSGVAKLRSSGLSWITTDLLRHYIAYDALRKVELGSIHSPLGPWLASYQWPFRLLAAFTLLIELGAPFAVVSRRVARLWVPAIVAFHLGVLATMAILFPYPTFGLAFASFYPIEKLAERLRRKLSIFSMDSTQ